ncbi:MAG TPA: cytochrome P450 [Streptosporangiaceae bacterium]|jgi:cytochrome P450
MVSRQSAVVPQDEAGALLAELTAPAGRKNPYPVYDRLRALAPVYLASSGAAYLTTYDDCNAAIRDPSLGAQSPAWVDRVRPGWRDHPGLKTTHESFLFRDPPDHTRLRRLVSSAFTQRKAEALRRLVAGLVARALDQVADAGADGSAVDLHEILAARLPIAVVSHVLGVPEADFGRLREPLEGLRLAADGGASAANLPVIDAAATALLDYFGELAAERRRQPREDLTSTLVAIADSAAQDGAADPVLTELELLQSLTLIFSAAIESMVDLLLNGTLALLANPGQARLLRADPALGPGTVEEALRYDPPVQAMGRITATGTGFGGVRVTAGSLVLIMLGAANRDPARFPRPGEFDIRRQGPPVLSFGGGAHFCLGAALARLQAGVFFPGLLGRFPRLELASQPVRRGFVLRGFASFPVTLA